LANFGEKVRRSAVSFRWRFSMVYGVIELTVWQMANREKAGEVYRSPYESLSRVGVTPRLPRLYPEVTTRLPRCYLLFASN
jgi:hypothetical protein